MYSGWVLTSCPSCHGKVSEKVAVCPHCGAPLLKPVPCRSCGEPVFPGATTCSACHAPWGPPPSTAPSSMPHPAPTPPPQKTDSTASAQNKPHILKRYGFVLAIGSALPVLIVVAYFLVAKSDAQCARETACEQAGLCSASFHTCVAAKDADCAKSQNCIEYGECSSRQGKCIVAGDADCASLCKSTDRCVARDGVCVCDPSKAACCLQVGKCGVDEKGWCSTYTEQGCQQSVACRRDGLCSLSEKKDRCIASRDEHCTQSEVCKTEGRCQVRDGGCIGLNCADSEDCKVKGRCVQRDGRCVAASEADCRSSVWCIKLGRCKLEAGQCRASEQGCKASENCKSDSQCYLSTDGEACVTKPGSDR
ncbi:MAG TPA: hypothetical protein PLJ27_09045 [Polyangiaceae bacterium]|nr:hypothetical protein [Polyangiaceae bacterium]HNZ21779.1 hypothetical protein [Polyangiaceae bacterium]HOD23497.1 hypothetical protein [Polyangiaceae bacterium]HOE51516.1 hypothetical protein [Polyangiaceae bacterium]HOG99660.1 hypothetical protein [Polyangiaceae bacterium]